MIGPPSINILSHNMAHTLTKERKHQERCERKYDMSQTPLRDPACAKATRARMADLSSMLETVERYALLLEGRCGKIKAYCEEDGLK